uniref:DUF7746 domain-containing protein n=1 Tax=Gossypium raimondii TaxID=29730 RepID=A0A0D2W4R2_GOSRA|nr:hypothetical protein B456_013G103100 [Gossypium raimondii]
MIVEQNNYTNINLHTIGKQLDYIESLVESQLIRKELVREITEKSSKEPIFTPYEIPKPFQKSQNDFLTEIQNRLHALESYKSELISLETPIQGQHSVNTLHQSSQSDSDQSDEQQINKMTWKEPKRLYYSKTTAPDLNIEEKHVFQNKYIVNTIYEWNIDGMSEYNILSLLQQMTMISNVYKTQNQNRLTSDHAIANLLVVGFTSQLKGWWDYALTKTRQEELLKAIKKDDQGRIILDEQGRKIQDAVATLIFSISKHFVGDPSHLKDRNSELLSNLKCKKLTDFKWYKDVFITRVMQRSDNQQPFWKEKFLVGLPTLLGEKVKNQIRENYRSIIPYEKLTYGELISFTQKEGFKFK